MIDNKKIRIRLYGEHLGYIRTDFYHYFLRKCNILDYSYWIKKTAHTDFNIYIKSKESINELKNLVLENYYDDTTDWLKVKMREELNKQK